MEEKFIENGIKISVKEIVRSKIDKEIDEKVEKFRRELEDRKDDYIAEVMKGIRIYHERNIGSEGINYKITFENIYRLEKVEEERWEIWHRRYDINAIHRTSGVARKMQDGKMVGAFIVADREQFFNIKNGKENKDGRQWFIFAICRTN